ncbi:MAG: response regulator [Betaproteobacteria bacterium]
MSGEQILIIDDEASIRANIQRFLRLEGYVVHEAMNGLSGLACVAANRPDLILCDVMMPEMDGFTVLAKLRKDADMATIPFIFLTASVEQDDQRFGLSQGADAYLAKPFNLAELLALVKRKLEQ